jgi:hypothetical protein
MFIRERTHFGLPAHIETIFSWQRAAAGFEDAKNQRAL